MGDTKSNNELLTKYKNTPRDCTFFNKENWGRGGGGETVGPNKFLKCQWCLNTKITEDLVDQSHLLQSKNV